MRHSLLWVALALLGLLPLLGGCGGTAPRKAHVTGLVTVDGQPLAEGTILFSSADNTSPTAGGNIKGGVYAVEVYTGRMRVQISSLRVVGKRKAYNAPDSPFRDVTAEQVPAPYNTRTRLTADIEPGEEKIDFPLQRRYATRAGCR